MRNLKIQILFAVFAHLMTTTASARQLSVEEAVVKVSDTFLTGTTRSGLQPLYTEVNGDLKVAYVFSLHNSEGYVVLAADDLLPTVLGYSYDGVFDGESMPPAMKYWLSEYGRQLKYAESCGQISYVRKKIEERPSIAPLCESTWSQSRPFNDNCPTINGSKSPAGCTATAMAQVMYTHKWPITGTGTNTYIYGTAKEKLTFDFGATTFDWDNMLPSYRDGYSEAEGVAVATLMEACGNASLMSYGSSASGAYPYDAIYGMVNFLGYDKSAVMLERDFYSSGVWDNIIYSELEEGRPVIYGGYDSSYQNGHTFIVDGYGGDGLYHINWGWSGMSDGYFRLSALDPSEQGIGGLASGYNFRQDAIINLMPAREDSKYALEVMWDGSFLPVDDTYSSNDKAVFKVGEGGNINGFTLRNVMVKMGLLLTPYEGGESFFCAGKELRFYSMYGYYSNSGHDRFSIDVSNLPKEGSYIAVPAFEYDGEVEEIAVKAGKVRSVMIHCSEEGIKFEKINVERTITATNIKSEKKLYSGRNCEITAEIHNSGEEYLGVISAGFIDSDGTMLCSLPSVPVTLAEGESMAVIFSGILESNTFALPAGDYIFDVMDEDGNSICVDSVIMTVHEIPTGKPSYTFDLSMKGNHSGQGTYSSPYLIGDEVEMEMTLSVDSGLFDDAVMLYAYYADGEEDADFTSDSQYYREMFVTPGDTEQVTFHLGTSDFELDKVVFVQAYGWKPDWSAASQGWLGKEIYMKRVANGVTEIVDAKGRIYPNPAMTDVTISEVAPIRSVRIYALTGVEVINCRFSGSESIVKVDVSSLSSGHYIVEVNTNAGTECHRLLKK
ncbi:MAG: thiol protease/hemagglutinin PrtT [Muribaculaceae bacterium]|nr:thiol protease/hemagglutinin PrtT [Muribaculaceae bacterium]